MLKVIISYLIAVIQVAQIVSAGAFNIPPEDNGVIDVTFDFMNGEKAYSFVAEEGETITPPESPENRGLVFDGWYNGKEKWNFEKDTVSQDLTLTAKWKFSDTVFDNDPDAGVRADGSDIRVMSFNILASDWSNKPAVKGRDDKMRDVISRYKPDVAGLQEVNAEWYDSLKAEFMSYKLVNEDKIKIRGNVNYSTIAYNTETVNLIRWGQTPYAVNYNKNCRNFMWAVFEMKNEPGKRFIVTCTHFDLTSDRRVHQAIEIAGLLKILGHKYNLPMFCTGDYNMREDTPEYYTFSQLTSFESSKFCAKERGLVASTSHLGDGTGSADDYTSGYWKLGTVSYRQKEINTYKSIDHIFTNCPEQVLYYDTVVDETALEASDHCPIYADIAL
ncbi:MAG: InlB B-repeat-containing protein [Clostridia bacterium]|nr:InlB B-repeat-containing protein [Clostridia bacterium]